MNNDKNFSIKNWAEDDRPREKLRIKGRNSLSDAELIAILIGSGNKNESAVELSKRILNSVDRNLDSLGKLSFEELCKFKGIGEAKAITILAALEIGLRRKAFITTKEKRLRFSDDYFKILQANLTDLTHEEFWVIFLKKNLGYIDKECVGSGTIDKTAVDMRGIIKSALLKNASSIVLAHNHPSGNLSASAQDISLTQKLIAMCKLFDIYLVDHIIICGKNYFSFSDKGYLKGT